MDLTKHYANHIIPSYWHLVVGCSIYLISVAALEASSHRFNCKHTIIKFQNNLFFLIKTFHYKSIISFMLR
jgi:hypothetical protein